MNGTYRAGAGFIQLLMIISLASCATPDRLKKDEQSLTDNPDGKTTAVDTSDNPNYQRTDQLTDQSTDQSANKSIEPATGKLLVDSTGGSINSELTQSAVYLNRKTGIHSHNSVSAPINCGHKGGYDCMKELPENSLALLEHLEELQRHPRFRYLEFDIRETKDHKLVVFHDKYIARMLPDKGYNKQRYRELKSLTNGGGSVPGRKPALFWKVSDLTLEQLQTLSLEGREPSSDDMHLFKVPTLEKYIDRLGDRLTKPIVFDIKHAKSTSGSEELLRAITNYATKIGGNRPSTTRYNRFPYQQVSAINLTGLKNSLPEPGAFCASLKKEGITIYRGFTHDSVCDFHYNSDINPGKPHVPYKFFSAIKRVGVKHHIQLIESELDPANYYKPRLVHLEPAGTKKPHRFIYTPIAQTTQALERLEQINKNKLIVFLHGRGRHPDKGEPMLTELAERHNAAVVMFDWDSWICTSYCKEKIKQYSSKHPYGNAIAAAPELANFLAALHDFKQDRPDLKISLLAHSMGNIVFREMINNWKLKERSGAFIENLILNSADVERHNHKSWLERVSLAREIFVTLSRGDLALGAVEYMLYKPLLGQGFPPNASAGDISLAKNAHYPDFSEVSRSHRKFGTRNPVFRQFFTSALGDDNWAHCLQNTPIDMKVFDYSCVE